MSDEVWKDIDGWPYQVSNYGRVRRIRYLEPQETVGGYLRVEMNDGPATTRKLVHRLVATAFHGPCPAGKQVVAHRDGNPKNNRADNLYWATPLENAADRRRHGNYRSGEASPTAKLSNVDAMIVRARHHSSGESVSALSRSFGTSRQLILRIVTNKSYRTAGGYGT